MASDLSAAQALPTGAGLPQFCPAGADPYETVEWEERTAQIKDTRGQVLFEQTGCGVPKA